MVLETERLILREYRLDDFEALFEILSDAETMQHYPKPYDEEMTKHWIEWNIQNYREYGFGIWAVELKETGTFIGDCGMTIQNIDGELLPEIGYHIHKKYWRFRLLREVTALVCCMEVRAITYAPRSLAALASSTGTALRPELEMEISTSPALMGYFSSRMGSQPSSRSSRVDFAAEMCSISFSSRMGQTLAMPPAR